MIFTSEGGYEDNVYKALKQWMFNKCQLWPYQKPDNFNLSSPSYYHLFPKLPQWFLNWCFYLHFCLESSYHTAAWTIFLNVNQVYSNPYVDFSSCFAQNPKPTMAYKALCYLAFVSFSDILSYWFPLSPTFIKSPFCCGSLTMQACSSSGTFYMLISLIGMLLIPGIHITHDLIWPFIQVSPQISSPQEIFLGHSI